MKKASEFSYTVICLENSSRKEGSSCRILLPLSNSSVVSNIPFAKSEDKTLVTAFFTFVNPYSYLSPPSPRMDFHWSQDQSVSQSLWRKSVTTCRRNYLINWNLSLKQWREDSMWLTAKECAFLYTITLKKLL